MGFFDAMTAGCRSPRTGRAAERAALTIYRALTIRQEAVGGGSADKPAAPRAPRRTRASSRKPSSGGDSDSDGEPAPARRVAPLLYDLQEVADAVALSTRGVQRLVQEGSFPKPRALSPRRVAWRVVDIEAWVAALPVAEMLPPSNPC